MSDEFDHSHDNNYSSFWPLLILVAGLLIWFGIQDYLLNGQRAAYARQFKDAQFQATLVQADNISGRYVALMKDLVETSQKDPAAADIVKAAMAANLIHVQPNATNGAATPAEPAASK